MAETLLDGDRIAGLRSALGLSQRDLAAEVGLTSAAMGLVEQGRNHEDLQLRVIRRTAEVLGVEPSSLFSREPEASGATSPRPEDVLLEAALATANGPVRKEAVAVALGWRLDRLCAVLAALDRRLEQTGLRVHRGSEGLNLKPRGVLRDSEVEAINRARLGSGGANVSAMRLLLLAVRQPLDSAWERRAGNNERVNRGRLQNAGLFHRTSRGLEPSRAVRRSLRLDP